MTHHHENDENGVEVEKWILRALLLAVLGTLAAAVLGSLDDTKRAHTTDVR